MIFNGINVNGRQIWETQNTVTTQKNPELAFEIGLPVDETQFSKTTITKRDTFFTYVNVNISKY